MVDSSFSCREREQTGQDAYFVERKTNKKERKGKQIKKKKRKSKK
jgi:hypothetical protein